jgi:hypothetical protein
MKYFVFFLQWDECILNTDSEERMNLGSYTMLRELLHLQTGILLELHKDISVFLYQSYFSTVVMTASINT